MAQLIVWTLEDVVEHILDSVNVERTNRNLRLARRAADGANREFPDRTDWTHYRSEELLYTAASFTNASGVNWVQSERSLTLVDGTDSWPSSVRYYRVIIDNVHYRVESRESNTKIILSFDSDLGADDTALSFTAYRPSQFLPEDFRKMGELYDITQRRKLTRMGHEELHANSTVWWDTPSIPWFYTIRGMDETYAGPQVVFGPPPNSRREYGLTYQRSPRALRTYKYNTGTVTVSSDSTSVTGSGTAWTSDMVGSVLRLSSGATAPTGPYGTRDDDNPFALQRIIMSVDSATALTIDAVPGDNYSGVAHTISDPVDVKAGSMFTAFLRRCEWEFSRLALREDANDKFQAYLAAEAQAKSDDRIDITGDSSAVYHWWRLPTINDVG